MEESIIQQYIHTLFRFRKIGMNYPRLSKLTRAELFLMLGLAGRDGCDEPVDLGMLQGQLFVSKAAISQMLSQLDREGYVVRRTDATNRRRITVQLTDQGRELMNDMKAEGERQIGAVLTRFGQDNATRLIVQVNRLLDITEEMTAEADHDGSAAMREAGRQGCERTDAAGRPLLKKGNEVMKTDVAAKG